jgi:acyl carrier protein
MDEKETRLAECFLAVFPELSADDITKASSSSVDSWDSVAVVTLLSVVEEEFGISIEVDDLARFDSFRGILSYLRETEDVRQRSTGAS